MKKYRLEVGRSRSHAWPWFVRAAKRMPAYEVLHEDDLELHCIESQSLANILAIYEIIRSWKGWAFYIDGRPAKRRTLWDLDFEQRRAEINGARSADGARLPELPTRNTEQENRWRMGLGPKPDADAPEG